MYVVLSGECEIRSRPAHAASIPQQQSQPTSTILVGPQPGHDAHNSDGDTSEEEEESCASTLPRAARSEAEHSASFWIHKYMQQVNSAMHSECSPALHSALYSSCVWSHMGFEPFICQRWVLMGSCAT